ncbi:MAG: cytidylate kinase family protein [Candidatus Kerfeldbacteria bacterium]|nr:cytidylate kinase family protein [Candidatus Kerfeldbacteria bacterium]
MIITISGLPGSGKGTVGRLLARQLGYRYYSIGDLRRAMARERGLTLEELNTLGERQPFTDRQVDRWQATLGRTRDNLIVEGRTSFYFIPHSVKVFLSVSRREAGRRIASDQNHLRRFEAGSHFTNIKTVMDALSRRFASDTRRYRKYYSLDIFDRKHYDLYLATTHKSPKQVANEIMMFLAKIRQRKHHVEKTRKSSKHSTRVRSKNVDKKRLKMAKVRGYKYL